MQEARPRAVRGEGGALLLTPFTAASWRVACQLLGEAGGRARPRGCLLKLPWKHPGAHGWGPPSAVGAPARPAPRNWPRVSERVRAGRSRHTPS